MRTLLATWFPSPQRGVGIGWFFACTLGPPALLLSLAVLVGSAFFFRAVTGGTDDGPGMRIATKRLYEQELEEIRIGMTRDEFYALRLWNVGRRRDGSPPKPTRAAPHPGVHLSFVDLDRDLCISFDAHDRVASWRAAPLGRCSRR